MQSHRIGECRCDPRPIPDVRGESGVLAGDIRGHTCARDAVPEALRNLEGVEGGVFIAAAFDTGLTNAGIAERAGDDQVAADAVDFESEVGAAGHATTKV